MTDLYKLLAEKFTSGNSIEVERITITRKEYEAALAQPEQEPFKPDWVIYRQGVADGAAQPEQESISTNDHLCAMLRQVHDVLACTALPMKRKWVGLTGLELNHIFAAHVEYPERMCRAIEAKLKEKNCG